MTTIKQSICTGCPLLCDDVTFKIDATTISSDVDCSVAQSWIADANQFLAAAPKASVDRLAIAKSVGEKLKSANAPMIVGLNHLTTEAQQQAWRIADAVGATIDVTLSKSNRASIYSMQRQGKITATLGEIANRSDLIVFWFCDPVTTHPRLLHRLTQSPSSCKKHIVVVGDPNTATASVANEVFAVGHEEASDLIREVRLAISPKHDSPKSITSNATQLAELLRSCHYGSWICGHTDLPAELDDVTLDSQALVWELNDHTRFVSLDLRTDQNAASGENVLASFSGAPVAVSLAMGFPQYNGAEYSAESILENGETDFVLLFAGAGTTEEIASLSPQAQGYLAKVPKAVVSSAGKLDLASDILIETDPPGVSDSGEFCRIDDVSLKVDRLVKGNCGSAFDFLRMIRSSF